MNHFLLVFFMLLALPAQGQGLTEPVSGGSVKATVGEQIGLTEVKIIYSRPAVRGREGKIWGSLIKQGFANGGPDEQIPWRAGANETTTIEFSTDALLEGKLVKQGKYGLFIAYDSASSLVILSRLNDSWGSFFYTPSDDYLRVSVKNRALERSVERLTYDFSEQNDSSALIGLSWERVCIPFKVSVNLQQQQMASYERELKTVKGFSPDAWLQYADYVLETDTGAEKAYQYASSAAESAPSFRAYRIRAEALGKLHRRQEQLESLKSAVYYGSLMQVHYYALGKLEKGDLDVALYLLRLNYDKAPSDFYTNYGLAVAHRRNDESGKAKTYARRAQKYAQTAEQRSAAAALLGEKT